MIGALQAALANPQSGAALLGAMIGVLGSLLVTFATGLLNRGKFKREALWEKRQIVCNEIVSSLQASAGLAGAIEQGFDEDAYGFYEGAELTRLNGLYAEKIAAAHEAFHRGYLILPPRFRRRYERLEREREAWWHSAGPDIYLDQIAANERGRRDLFDLARVELGIVPAWQRFGIRARFIGKAIADGTKRRWRLVRRAWRRKFLNRIA